MSAPDEQAECREHHRARDRRPLEAARDGGVGEQRQRDRRQGPVHVQTLLAGVSGRLPLLRPSAGGVEAPPVVEIVPSTVPFETVQSECTVRVSPPGSVQVPVKPRSSSEVSVPSQVVPPAKRSWSALSATWFAAREEVDPEGRAGRGGAADRDDARAVVLSIVPVRSAVELGDARRRRAAGALRASMPAGAGRRGRARRRGRRPRRRARCRAAARRAPGRTAEPLRPPRVATVSA